MKSAQLENLMQTKESRRRSFLRSLSQAGVALGLTQLLPIRSLKTIAQTAAAKIAGKEKLIVRSARPEDLETPVELFNSWITPNDTFYVRHHGYVPEVNAADWKLTIEGEVGKPMSFTLDDLKKLPKATVTVTLECAGNGRAFMEPPVAGIQWEKGAVGTAKWGGVKLADVLKAAGVKPTGKFVYLNGADVGVGKQPDFVRQVPMEKAMHPDTVLAYEMNDQPLPKLHGAPLRAVISGWEGAYAVKWLNQITVADKESDSFWVKTAYRFPTKRVAPGAAVDAKDMAPVSGLVVKSLISAPADGSAAKVGSAVRVSGFAWAGEATVYMKRRWPRWVPPREMVDRDERAVKWANGQPGGPDNPLGARALYLQANGVDTLYRIHGTNDPSSIGKAISSGCIRLLNQDIAELFLQVPIGTRVVVIAAQGESVSQINENALPGADDQGFY